MFEAALTAGTGAAEPVSRAGDSGGAGAPSDLGYLDLQCGTKRRLERQTLWGNLYLRISKEGKR